MKRKEFTTFADIRHSMLATVSQSTYKKNTPEEKFRLYVLRQKALGRNVTAREAVKHRESLIAEIRKPKRKKRTQILVVRTPAKDLKPVKRQPKINAARPGSLTAEEVSALIGYSHSTPFEYAEEWGLTVKIRLNDNYTTYIKKA